MNIHSNARTCPNSRAVVVEHADASAWSEDQAAVMGVSVRTGYKWLRRYREEGPEGLTDRSSRPHSMPRLTPAARAELVVKLRNCRLTGREIAHKLRMPRSTVAAILQRAGLSRFKDLEPPDPVVRYERERPGDLIHLDIKKLGRIVKPGHRITGNRRERSRGAGWEYVHVAIDDASRLAYVEVLANEQADTTLGFLKRTLIFFRRHRITVRRVMTDNGSAYVSRVFAALCLERNLRHLRTKPYRPCTNGKAERLIQTLLREWAYKRRYRSSADRIAALPSWLYHYNHRRSHAALGGKSPMARVVAQ
jgi:transposase InsO family protein